MLSCAVRPLTHVGRDTVGGGTDRSAFDKMGTCLYLESQDAASFADAPVAASAAIEVLVCRLLTA